MRKLIDIKIGNNIPKYHLYGTPTAFIVQKDDRFMAYCPICGCKYCLDWWPYQGRLHCPGCGHKSEWPTIMYGQMGSILPYKVHLRLYDFKDKLQMKVTSSGLKITTKMSEHWPTQQVQETFTMDFTDMTVQWERQDEGNEERIELGYIQDYESLKEKSMLWFFSFNHKIKKGNSFTEFLRALRDAMQRHFKRQGIRPKHWYRQCPKKYKLYANVLSACRAVRFYDAGAVPFGSADFETWRKEVLGEPLLPPSWEQDVWQKMHDGKTYHQAMTEVLSLPSIPSVYKAMKYETLVPLYKAYGFHNIDLAHNILPSLFQFYGQKTEFQDVVECIQFIHSQYPDIKIRPLLEKHWYHCKDILYLWRQADVVTKQAFYAQQISWRKVHDWLAVAVAKQEGREVLFDIPVSIQNTLNVQIQAVTFQCIERKSELKAAALILKNCAAGYEKRIGTNVQLVQVSEQGQVKALLEIHANRVIQAKLFGNRAVKMDTHIHLACLQYLQQTQVQCQTDDICQTEQYALCI